MIQASSAFTTANAALAKKPIFLVDIDGYFRAFSTVAVPFDPGFAIATGYQSNPFGGLEAFPQDVTLGVFSNRAGATTGAPRAATPGSLLIAVAMAHSSIGPTISDSNGNSWTALQTYPPGGTGLCIWVATANSSADPLVVNFSCGANGDSFYGVIEVIASAGSYSYAFNSGTGSTASVTVASYNLSINLRFSDTWGLFAVEFGGGVPGSTYRLAFLFPGDLNLSGSLPSDWFEYDGTLFPGHTFGSITFGFSDILSSPWLVSVDDQKLTVSDLDGGADLADLTFTVQDRGQQLTADLSTFVFEGKECRLLMGFVGMDIADYLTMFTGQIDSVDSANGNLEYLFTVSDVNLQKLTQKIYTVGDDGFAVSSSHPKTLLDHPLNILVDALQQAGISLAKIDTDKIQFYRDGVFSGYIFNFNLTGAQTAKDFVENEIMKPLGMYLWQNNLGMVSVNSFYPAVPGNGTYTPPTPPVITAVCSTNPPDVNQFDAPLAQEAPLVNQVIFDFDAASDGNSGFLAEQVVDLDASIAKYGLVGGQTIQSQGMRSGFQGYFLAAFVGRLISLRYGFKNLIFDPLPLTWNACVLEPGDIIAVTNPFVPDRVAGVLGISGMFFEVLDRNWRFMDGVIEVKLLAIDYSLFKQYDITSNGEADYASASTADKAALMFQCGADGKYSTGLPANTLG